MNVAVLALDGVLPFELSIPGQVFGAANEVASLEHYRIQVCAPHRTVTTSSGHGSFHIQLQHGLEAVAQADTIILPAHADFLDTPPAPVTLALRAAAQRGARLASICVGAFTLAATGLLDGQRATTHWQHAHELSRRHPQVEIDSNVLFIDNGAVLTSAGVAAGLDLCLHLVHQDLGADMAAATARATVMPLQRDGGQAQFIEHTWPATTGTSTLESTMRWMSANVHRALSLQDIAEHAALSVRSLN